MAKNNEIEKISKDTFLIWFSQSNKYIVLNDKLADLIILKSKLTKKEFVEEISKILSIDINDSMKVEADISKLIKDCLKEEKKSLKRVCN